MRFHPAVYHNFRQAVKDEVLPLLRPISTVSGKVLPELPIPRGLKIIISICGYNRFVDPLLLVRIVGAQRCVTLFWSYILSIFPCNTVIPTCTFCVCTFVTAETGIKRFSAKTQIFSTRKDGPGILARSKV